DKRGADSLKAALLKDSLLLQQDAESAGRAAEHDADLVQEAIPDEPGIHECLLGRRHTKLRIAVHPAKLLGFNPAGGVESLDLAGDLNRILAGVEHGDPSDPCLTFQHGCTCAGLFTTVGA